MVSRFQLVKEFISRSSSGMTSNELTESFISQHPLEWKYQPKSPVDPFAGMEVHVRLCEEEARARDFRVVRNYIQMLQGR